MMDALADAASRDDEYPVVLEPQKVQCSDSGSRIWQHLVALGDELPPRFTCTGVLHVTTTPPAQSGVPGANEIKRRISDRGVLTRADLYDDELSREHDRGDIDAAVETLRGRLRIMPGESASELTISYRGEDPNSARRVVSELVAITMEKFRIEPATEWIIELSDPPSLLEPAGGAPAMTALAGTALGVLFGLPYLFTTGTERTRHS